MKRVILAFVGSLSVLAALPACESQFDPKYNPYDLFRDKDEKAASARVHYYHPNEPDLVYYYEELTPDTVVRRRYYRDADGTTYYYESESGTERRVYFDDKEARRLQRR